MQRIEAGSQMSVDQFFSRLAANFGIVRGFARTQAMPEPFVPIPDAIGTTDRYVQASTEFATLSLQMLQDPQVAQLVMDAQPGFIENRIFSYPFPSQWGYGGESGMQVVHFGRLNEQEEPKPIITITTGRMTTARQEYRSRFEATANEMYPSSIEIPWQFEEIDMERTAYFRFRAQRELIAGDLIANPDLFRHFLSWLDRRLANAVKNIKNLSITTQQEAEFDEMILLFQEANRLARRALGETPPDKPYQI